MYDKKIEYMTPKEVEASCIVLKPEENPYICETAGFIPLEVKFKRFELAGQVAKINASEFTSQDYRDMYMCPDFEIYPDDDPEEIFEKAQLLRKHIAEIKIQAMQRNVNQVKKEEKEITEKSEEKE